MRSGEMFSTIHAIGCAAGLAMLILLLPLNAASQNTCTSKKTLAPEMLRLSYDLQDELARVALRTDGDPDKAEGLAMEAQYLLIRWRAAPDNLTPGGRCG